MSERVILRPISERAARAAVGDVALADALVSNAAPKGLEPTDALEARLLPYSGVDALGLGWIFEAGAAIGSERKYGRARILDASDADRALMAVRDVTWSGGDDIRDDLERVFARAVDGNLHVVVAIES